MSYGGPEEAKRLNDIHRGTREARRGEPAELPRTDRDKLISMGWAMESALQKNPNVENVTLLLRIDQFKLLHKLVKSALALGAEIVEDL